MFVVVHIQVSIKSHRSPSINDVESDANSKILYETGLERFRNIVIDSCKMKHHDTCTTSEAPGIPCFFVICNFSRKVLGQTGDGHFSPIGGELHCVLCVLCSSRRT